MASYYDNRTPAWQRIVIWIIAIAMAGGTLVGFFFMAIATQNPNLGTAGIAKKKEEQAQKELNEKTAEHQKKVDAQNEELGKKYFAEFNSYKSHIVAFEPTGIGDVKTEDLKTGDGVEISANNGSAYSMYYIGWKPNGDIFDSSLDGEKLKSPLPGGGSYITGWNEGVIGMKIGGVRLIIIPPDKAYTDDSHKEHELYGLPLKFIVMAIPTPAEVPYPKGTVAACEKAMTSQAAQYGMTAVQLCQYYSNEEK